MKKILLTIIFAILAILSEAQEVIYTVVDVTTPGTLKTRLRQVTPDPYIFYLKVTGNIDATDIKFLRDENLALAFLDLSETTIYEYTGTNGTYIYPIRMTYKANELPTYAFSNSYSLKGQSPLVSIILPNTITAIGNFAFYSCTGLTDVTIQNAVTYIGKCAFYKCYSIKNIIIPNSVTQIDDAAFEDCSQITSLDLPNSVTKIGASAISNCPKLTSIKMGNSVSYMGDGSISYCPNLLTISFAGVNPPEFGGNHFVNLLSLIAIYVPPASVEAYKASKIGDMHAPVIQASLTSDLKNPLSQVKVYNNQSMIYVEGIQPGEKISVYGVNGQLLMSCKSDSESKKIPVKEKGIYLIKVGSNRYKLVL